MSEQNFQNDDEIDLSEFLGSLWSHKILVFSLLYINIFFWFVCFINERKYTAKLYLTLSKASRGLSLAES